MGGVSFVKIMWKVGGWCVFCTGKRVQNRVVVVCEKGNGRCELQVR